LLPPAKPSASDQHAVKVDGGTDLFVKQPEQLCAKPLNFLKSKENHECVRLQNSQCIINAATPIEQLRAPEELQSLFPAIGEEFMLICSAPVRQRATVGGNLVNAASIGDLPVFFQALDASLRIVGTKQERAVKLHVTLLYFYVSLHMALTRK